MNRNLLARRNAVYLANEARSTQHEPIVRPRRAPHCLGEHPPIDGSAHNSEFRPSVSSGIRIDVWSDALGFEQLTTRCDPAPQPGTIGSFA